MPAMTAVQRRNARRKEAERESLLQELYTSMERDARSERSCARMRLTRRLLKLIAFVLWLWLMCTALRWFTLGAEQGNAAHVQAGSMLLGLGIFGPCALRRML